MVGDVGGTHARFAVMGDGPRDLTNVEILRCAEYQRIEDAVDAYRRKHRIGTIVETCLAVAGPTDQDPIDLPNNHWSFCRRTLEATLGSPLMVINDFTAQALSIDVLAESELTWFGTPRPHDSGIRTVLGAGTGLGIAIQTSAGEIIPSEGGHVGFAPVNEHEIALLRALSTRYRRVSIERLLSGPGLENLFWSNRQILHPDHTHERSSWTAQGIAGLAAEGDPVALQSVQDFFDILAGFAGDVALFTWSTGGVYLSGGVLRKLSTFLDVERFRSRFEDKGRFTRFCETVPLAWITHDVPGLLGCAAALDRAPGPGAFAASAVDAAVQEPPTELPST